VAVGPAVVALGILLTSCSRSAGLHNAAARGQLAAIDRYMKRGAAVNAQDARGNTPLHYAYFHDHEDAVARLTAYGADGTIRNHDGEVPADMREAGRADRMVTECARLLDRQGNWKNESEARRRYDELSELDAAIVTRALVRQVGEDENRLCVLLLAVKLGIPGSEARLNEVLELYGDISMAEDYLNCGSRALYEGGERWATSRGYTINSGGGSHRAKWGQF